MKKEALKLADYVEAREINNPHLKEASTMIRRLVEELDKVPEVVFDEGVYRWWLPNGDEFVIVPQTQKPLSDEEIDEVSKAIWERPWLEKHREFARAIEERHGIK